MTTKTLNILLVISKMGKGGAQRIVLDLANGLVARGENVDLLVFFRTPQDAILLDMLDPRVKLLNIFNILLDSDHQSRTQKFISVILLPVFTLWWVISGNLKKYHIVHSHLLLASLFSWFASVFQKVRRWPQPKYVETFHGDLVALAKWEQIFYFFLWKKRDILVTEIRRKDYWIVQSRLPNVQVRYIPFGIIPLTPADAQETAAFRKQYSIGEDVPVILSIARLNNREKKISDLVSVIDRFRKMYPGEFVYMIIGDGPDRTRVKNQVKSLGLEGIVRFTGYLDNISVPCTVAKVFLVTGIEDLVGIAGLQAASMGLPIVSYQLDPSWRNENPIFFNSNSLPTLATEIKRLLLDEQYYQEASANSISAVHSIFSADQMLTSYLSLYEELAEGRCVRRPVEIST
jgi:glycosyltransferase involved in cell wall biosynthesis